MAKKAVISGATKGVGRAIAVALANEGFDLALAARSEKDLNHLKNQLIHNSNIIISATDLSKEEGVKKFSGMILDRWGHADIIINNVGNYAMGGVSETTDDQLKASLDINFFSAWHLTQPFLKGMKERQSGFIINICSAVNLKPRKEAAAYTLSKDMLKSYNDLLREEMRDHNVKVTAVIPGSINTASWEGIDAPLEQFVQPEDVAAAVISAVKTSKHAFIEEIVVNPLNRKF